MKATPHSALFLGVAAAILVGCAQQPTAGDTFTIRKIDSTSARHDGSVRIKLSTPGSYAEADENLVVQFAQVIAVREATASQRQIAASRARASARKIAARSSSPIHSRRVRYIAVKTERSAPSPNEKAHAVASVMIWDTETQEIVGNKVYEVSSEPKAGAVARFETYTAEYVGSGL